MRIVFDLDGVICELKKPSESYSEVIPKKKVIQKMRDLKEEGHYLIIHTGRHMRTCEGDVGKVIEKEENFFVEFFVDINQIKYVNINK